MKGLASGGLCLMLLMSAAHAESGGDGGGRDVSVALFSTRVLHRVTLTPLSAGAWVARCARCAHEALAGPMHFSGASFFEAPRVEVFAGGSLRLTDEESGESRAASGLWHLRSSGAAQELDAVLTLPSERYVAAVLNGEAAVDEPGESLRALAVVARTYALNGSHFHPLLGHLPAELCDSTACQAMRFGAVPASIQDAVRSTAGETLWFQGKRAEVYFSESCGGVTEDAGVQWPRLRGTAYLRSHADAYCVRRGVAAWHAEVPLDQVAAMAHREGWDVPARMVGARVAERSGSGRAVRIDFVGSDGAKVSVSASALRFAIGRALGWNRVRSDAYELALRRDALVFDGRGHGHGVGLCQWGAAEMAVEGKSAREVLAFYFPGTRMGITPADDGWRSFRAGEVTEVAVGWRSPSQEAELQGIWSEAQRRFPPRRKPEAKIVFAPTTEVFRQMTDQPGWALASTQGGTIVLQPQGVLEKQRGGVRATLLHEMLHVLVEAEANDHAPLWLREGLVEMLSGEAEAGGGGEPVSDAALMGTVSRVESERAHRAAAARVRRLAVRYGMPAVRGWLSSGVPAGIS